MTWVTPKDFYGGITARYTVLNEQIYGNMVFLRSRPSNSVVIAATSTTSTTFVEMTGSSISLASFGGEMLIELVGSSANNGTNTSYWDIAIDGIRVSGSLAGLTSITTTAANRNDNVGISIISDAGLLGRGTHTYSVHWRCTAGTLSGLAWLFVTEIR